MRSCYNRCQEFTVCLLPGKVATIPSLMSWNISPFKATVQQEAVCYQDSGYNSLIDVIEYFSMQGHCTAGSSVPSFVCVMR